MILVIDNYDSFTYNLVQYLGELGENLSVFRNDAITVDAIRALAPTHIVISPGPCTPNEAGISLELVERLAGEIPILGVCLGHQAIGQAFGARVVRADRVMHGKTSPMHHDGTSVHAGLPNPFTVMRYHSLTLAADSIPDVLRITATSDDGEIMALEHKLLPAVGLQYHPESIVTEHGKQILKNFLNTTIDVSQSWTTAG